MATPKPDGDDELLPLSEVAGRYGIRLSRLRRQVAERVIPGARKERVNGREQWVVPAETLEEFGLVPVGEADAAGTVDLVRIANEKLIAAGLSRIAHVLDERHVELMGAIGTANDLRAETEEARLAAARLEEQLTVASGRVAALEAEVTTLRAQVAEGEAVAEERDRLRTEVDTLTLRSRTLAASNGELQAQVAELQAQLAAPRRRGRRRLRNPG